MAKQKRKQRQADRDAAAFPSPPPTPPPTLSRQPSIAMPATYIPLLICSIGNPGPQYANTLHSAGHHLLRAVHALALRNFEYTAFTPQRSWGNGLVALPRTGGGLTWKGRTPGRSYFEGGAYTGDEGMEELWTWWRSTSYMNISGKGVAEAWKRWRLALRGAGCPAEVVEAAKLVVLHDELEKGWGKFVVRREKSSLKGHNGLKSIDASLGGANFIRIGVGIDRPVSRAPADVSQHVLRQLTTSEAKAISSIAGPVLEVLRDISEGK